MATPTPSSHPTALIAVTGMSPAIVTETVWALAHETPPIIPEDVYVLTTSRGAADLERELNQPRQDLNGQTVWQTLRQTLLGAQAQLDKRLTLHPPIFLTTHDPDRGTTRNLDDIRTPQDNADAAEAILDQIRRLTANDDLRLIASLAGGRKTMSALLACAMSLLGRKDDRLTHVLVNEPFDNPALQPRFFFPTTPPSRYELKTPQGTQTFTSQQAVLQLADVPFVPLRYLFRDQLGRFPGRFMELVRSATEIVSDTAEPVQLAYDAQNHIAYFDGVPVELSGRDIPFFEFLYLRAKAGQQPFASHYDAVEPFKVFLTQWAPKNLHVNLCSGGASDWVKGLDQDDFRKRLSSIRQRLSNAGIGLLIHRLFPPRGPLGIPSAQVVFEDAIGPAQKKSKKNLQVRSQKPQKSGVSRPKS